MWCSGFAGICSSQLPCAVALQCLKGPQPEAPQGEKRSLTGRDRGRLPLGSPAPAPPRRWLLPKGQSRPSPAQQPPSPVPFTAGIALRSFGLGFLAISNSSHLCIQDSKDCNKRNQLIKRRGGCTIAEPSRQLQLGPRKVVSTTSFLGVGVTQAGLKQDFVLPGEDTPVPPQSGVLLEGEE